MEKIIIYSTPTCPKCKMVKMKLTSANIEWEECQDMDKMMSLGIKSVPAIQYGDALITNFTEVNNFVNKRIEESKKG